MSECAAGAKPASAKPTPMRAAKNPPKLRVRPHTAVMMLQLAVNSAINRTRLTPRSISWAIGMPIKV